MQMVSQFAARRALANRAKNWSAINASAPALRRLERER